MSAAPKSIKLSDYRPPDFLVDRIELTFNLEEEVTRVRSRLSLRATEMKDGRTPPLILDGEDLAHLPCDAEGDGAYL